MKKFIITIIALGFFGSTSCMETEISSEQPTLPERILKIQKSYSSGQSPLAIPPIAAGSVVVAPMSRTKPPLEVTVAQAAVFARNPEKLKEMLQVQAIEREYLLNLFAEDPLNSGLAKRLVDAQNNLATLQYIAQTLAPKR